MGSCILPDDQKSGKISSRTNLRQLWRRCNIRFLINGLVCTATVRFVFLCDPETWPSETYIQCFSTFKHSSIDIIMWEHWIGNSEVRRQVVGRMVPSLTGTLNEDRLMRLMCFCECPQNTYLAMLCSPSKVIVGRLVKVVSR